MIGAKEVTNREFRQFSPEHAPGSFSGFELGGDEQPASRIAWRDAVLFCNWLSQKEGLAPAYEERGGNLVFIEPVGTGYRCRQRRSGRGRRVSRRARRITDFRGAMKRSLPPWIRKLRGRVRSRNRVERTALLPRRLPGCSASRSKRRQPTGALRCRRKCCRVGPRPIQDLFELERCGSGEGSHGPRDGRAARDPRFELETRERDAIATRYRDYGKEGREDVGFRIVRYQK